MGLEAATYIDDLVSSNPTSSDPVSAGDDHLRLIKTVLLASLGGIDGPVLNGSGGTLASAQDFIDLFDSVAALAGGLSSAGAIVGEVRAFYGDTADIPSGWHLCDGSDGTPDMRGRMAIGGNESPAEGLPLYEGSTTGGNLPGSQVTDPAGAHTHAISIDDHELVLDNLPAHYHHVGYDNGTGMSSGPEADSSKGIKANFPNSSSDGYNLKATDGTYAAEEPDVGRTSQAGAASVTAVTHTNAAAASGGSHTHSLGAGSLPPWHAVHWIMYTGV